MVPANLQLADPNYFIPSNIDVLLGASIFWDIMGTKRIRHNKHGPLPLKEKIEELGDSFQIATKRLKALERKLEKQPELKTWYHEFLKKYCTLGHMSKIQLKNESSDTAYYIPHHAVVKEDRGASKLRVVFDALCKTATGKSFNDLLIVGPIIQESLFEIVRLRQYKYAMSGDIIQMYCQIKVRTVDLKIQRILWRWNKEEPIRVFELNTVTYGMSCLPFLEIRCLKKIAQQNNDKYHQTSEII
ncbi:uncharacterized protein LOC113005149 [Solenopsis invicta]|uniref:uncharacterized protein LOC113005149 n=1 Tax=Solenopsis invicta TaxID=13686 RepID=UPI00193D25A3|nr:uncharacterized protein LOC113005149 [Solenopsis invicta]